MKSESQIRAMRTMIASRFKCEALEDGSRYIYRFNIPSSSNPNKKYVVSFDTTFDARHWCCGCVGWTRHRTCKHLKKMHSALRTAFEIG